MKDTWVPTEVRGDRLLDGAGAVGSHHRDMMFEPLLADVFHQLLQFGISQTAMEPSMLNGSAVNSPSPT